MTRGGLVLRIVPHGAHFTLRREHSLHGRSSAALAGLQREFSKAERSASQGPENESAQLNIVRMPMALNAIKKYEASGN
jgi:hypothetical protein